MAIAERQIQIPAHATDDDLSFVTLPVESCVIGTGLILSVIPIDFATQPLRRAISERHVVSSRITKTIRDSVEFRPQAGSA
jgi:hypothetical protein